MATCSEERAPGGMGAREREEYREHRGPKATEKIRSAPAPRLSPYAKRNNAVRPPCNAASSAIPRTTSRASKGTSISRSPPHKPGCASAPAIPARLPQASLATTGPPLNTKRGSNSVIFGLTRERHRTPVTQLHHQRQSNYVLEPVRLKKSGVKPLEPERLKKLIAAAAERSTSGVKGTPARHQSSLAPKVIPRPTANHMLATNKKKVPARRQGNNRPIKQDVTTEDPESQLLTQKFQSLLLTGRNRPKLCVNSQESHKLPSSQGPGIHQCTTSMSETTTQDDSNAGENLSKNDQQEPPKDLLNIKTTSSKEVARTMDIGDKDVREKSLDSECQTGNIQEQCPEGNMTLESDHYTKEHHNLEGPSPESSSGAFTNAAAMGDSNSSECSTQSEGTMTGEPSGDQCRSVQEAEVLSTKNVNMDSRQCSGESSEEETAASHGEISQHNSIQRNDVIRRSQGVLVLTQSTEENAIFIPKLKFEFTPDNSIDWATIPQTLTHNLDFQVKQNDLKTTKPWTPGGPTYSRSVLKRSSALNTFGPSVGDNTASELVSSEELKKGGPLSFSRIVDLSISFQGVYGEEDIPSDIPKILLIEENEED